MDVFLRQVIRLFSLGLLSLLAPFSVSAMSDVGFNELDYFGFKEPWLSSDAQQGLSHLLNGDGFHLAAPYSVVSMLETLANSVPDPVLVKSDTPEGQFKAYGRLPSPGWRNGVPEGFPLSLNIFNRRDPKDNQLYTFTNHNCFQCHAGVVNGTVTAGLNNTHIDHQSIRDISLKLALYAELPLRPTLSVFEEQNFSEFVQDIYSKIDPTFRFAQSRGENYGPYAVWVLLSRLIDPATHGLKPYPFGESSPYDEYFKNENGGYKPLPPIDPNPWWTQKYKASNYWYKDQVTRAQKPAHFSINFTSIHEAANENHAEHVKVVGRIIDYVMETKSPPYPKPLDADRVKMGRALFHGQETPQSGKGLDCYRCHGGYVRQEGFDDYTKPGGWKVYYYDEFRDVGTDPAYNQVLQSYRPLVQRIEGLKDYFEDPSLVPVGSVPDEEGYLAPPLVGVWASAPYFHNGSVPTLMHVLDSESRPTYWQKNNVDPFLYDLDNVGLKYVTMSAFDVHKASVGVAFLPALSKRSVEYRAIYDTTRWGRSNKGHRVGDKLTHNERLSIVEFLKSLSGPDIFIGN